jgi:Family of unknown function (DUF6226)
VITEADLLPAVDEAFAVTGTGLSPWPDPHPNLRSPREDEYSRVTDAAKWRIVGARADAWLTVLEQAHLARVERDASVRWTTTPPTQITRADRAVPSRPGAISLVVARSRIDDVDDAVVTFGVDDPAVCVGWLPQCACDACDPGSQNVLEELDRMVLGVVSGTFRHLVRGDSQILKFETEGWSGSNVRRHDVAAVLADPKGWRETSGPSWLSG